MNEYVLYAIEEDTADGESDLMHRMDEHGQGSPLVFALRSQAEDVIREIYTETGCYGDWRVIELSMTARFPEPHFCGNCGVWGDVAEHAGHDD